MSIKISLKSKKIKNVKLNQFIDKNGINQYNRDFDYLKMYSFESPSTPDEKRKNKEIYELAEKILSICKSEFYEGKYKLKDNKKGNIPLLDFYKTLLEERQESKGNYDRDAAFKHLEKYCSSHIQLKEIDTDFAQGFRRYPDTKTKNQ